MNYETKLPPSKLADGLSLLLAMLVFHLAILGLPFLTVLSVLSLV